MNRSSNRPISDELLSAYIDGLVTNEEKAEVEAAVSADPALAWELDTLRRTVELVRDLPHIPLPRSFVLTEEQVADVLAERRMRVDSPAVASRATPLRSTAPARQPGFGSDLLAFFNSGNLFLRNAAAVAALFLVIVLVTSPAAGTQSPQMAALSPEPATFAAQAESAPAPASAAKAAPASEEDAPPVSAVGVAPLSTDVAAPQAVEPATMKSAPAPLEQAAPAAAMPAPEMGAMPAESALESGPMVMRAAPAEMPPAGMAARSFPDIVEEEAAPGDVGLFSSTAPVENPASITPPMGSAEMSAAPTQESAVESVAAEGLVEESTSEESPILESAVEESPASEEVMAEPTASESLVSEPAVTSAEPMPQEQAQRDWSIWQIIQAALGGLALLFFLLWLGSQRRSDFS